MEVGVGFIPINFIITYKKEQHMYEVERFNPSVHILLFFKIHINGNKS